MRPLARSLPGSGLHAGATGKKDVAGRELFPDSRFTESFARTVFRRGYFGKKSPWRLSFLVQGRRFRDILGLSIDSGRSQ